jgi:hypothetical protein
LVESNNIRVSEVEKSPFKLALIKALPVSIAVLGLSFFSSLQEEKIITADKKNKIDKDDLIE